MKPIRGVIDLHCDTLTECHKKNLTIKSGLHFSLDKLPEPYRLCQTMAVFMPDDLRGDASVSYFDAVYSVFLSQMDAFGEEISWTRDTSGIAEAIRERRFTAILSVEGGSALGGRIENVRRLYDLGARMMTLTWNAENELAGGAGTDSGFTAFGREAVKEMERIGMAVDVSHLSDKGFYQLCEFAEKPFLASHSNSRRICGHRRNLTDDMFLEIAKRGGVAGLNYSRSFIRDDGKNGGFSDFLKHVHHFLSLGGEDALALGSDYDGTDIPDYLSGVEKLPQTAENLEKSGIPRSVVDKILFENANRYFNQLYGGRSHEL